MNYTQAQIDRANAVSLEDFLRTQGETLIKSGREYRWKEHDSLTVRGNKWFRHSQSKGGYAKHYERVKEKELPADTVKLIYERGEREIPAGRFFNGNPDPQLGKFERFEALPDDPDALQSLLQEERRSREQLPPGDFKAHMLPYIMMHGPMTTMTIRFCRWFMLPVKVGRKLI